MRDPVSPPPGTPYGRKDRGRSSSGQRTASNPPEKEIIAKHPTLQIGQSALRDQAEVRHELLLFPRHHPPPARGVVVPRKLCWHSFPIRRIRGNAANRRGKPTGTRTCRETALSCTGRASRAHDRTCQSSSEAQSSSIDS